MLYKHLALHHQGLLLPSSTPPRPSHPALLEQQLLRFSSLDPSQQKVAFGRVTYQPFRLRVPLGFSILEQILRLRRGRDHPPNTPKNAIILKQVYGVFTCWIDLKQGSRHPKNFWWPGGDLLLDPKVGPASWSWSVIPPSLPGSFQNRPIAPFKRFQMVPIFFFPETKAI